MIPQMLERRITLNLGQNLSRHPDYEYSKPVIEPMQIYIPFYADTPENRSIRYAMACYGIPDNPIPDMPKRTRHLDILIRERELETRAGLMRMQICQIWLMANKYSMAKIDRMIKVFSLEHLRLLSEIQHFKSLQEFEIQKLYS